MLLAPKVAEVVVGIPCCMSTRHTVQGREHLLCNRKLLRMFEEIVILPSFLMRYQIGYIAEGCETRGAANGGPWSSWPHWDRVKGSMGIQEMQQRNTRSMGA
jgi:hypothetical protein